MVIWKGDAQGAGFIFIFLYPILTVILTGMVKGTVFSAILLVIVIIESLVPSASQFEYHLDVSLRMIAVYILLLGSILVFETSRQNKDKINHNLLNELAQERDIIQTMKDNINQGIFLMDRELRILPNYSKPLAAILSYYDSELAGKSFLDILSASLDIRQLQTMKDYFEMIFSKTHNVEVLESANPISEFEYRTDGRIKILTTKFELIEEADCESLIIGIIQDITREKEFAKELQAQKEAQELEMVNMFDVIQVDPLVFRDFIEDTESNFNQINSVLKDSSMTEKQALTKFFQNVHAIKSNALILGLRTFGRKLHALEDEIKAVSDNDKIIVEDILGLVIKLEEIMQEKDSYTRIIKKIEAFKVSNQIDTVLIHSMTKAAEKISMETQKKVELKTGQIDIGILETKLRKPIKDILFQCIRNSIYHGIEPIDERIQKNKKPQGLLAFSIKNVNGNAEVTFSDDGRGLDWNKIKARYLSMYPDARKPGKKVLLEAIFSPEFSTTESASTIAGRGVGLSLVKDLVKENNGSIKVDSSNSGLTLKFTFPPVS
jgi:two-component system chemotaxis sensor kinase CheA